MPQTSKSGKYFFISLASIVGLLLVIFLFYLIYYTIQLRYGNSETIQKIVSTYEKNFSSIIDKDAPADVANYQTLIKSDNPKKGEATAPITIIAFMDFECPYCQDNYSIFKYVTNKYSPVLQIVFKNLPLTEIHSNALPSALAASCANDQGKFWEYYDRLYTDKNLTEENFYSLAKTLNLDSVQFDNCYKNKIHINQIEADLQDAAKIGLRGTPTYVVNGEVVEGEITNQQWDDLIIKYLNKK